MTRPESSRFFAPYFHPVIGRPSTSAECYLRLMFLKFRYRVGFESLRGEVSDPISWAAVLPDPAEWEGAASSHDVGEAEQPVREAAVAGLNEALRARPAGQKLLRTARVRAEPPALS